MNATYQLIKDLMVVQKAVFKSAIPPCVPLKPDDAPNPSLDKVIYELDFW